MTELVSNPQEIGNLKYITKKDEFKAFLGLIKGHKLAIGKRKGYNILTISKALDIDRKTLKTWLNTPVAQKLIREELEYYLDMMMTTGKDDWRQWKAQVDLAMESTNSKEQAYGNTNILIVNNKDEFSVHMNE